MKHLPALLYATPVVIALLTVAIYYKATNKSRTTIVILIAWLALHTALSLSGFYLVTDVVPPRFMLALLPAVIVMIGLLTTKAGKRYTDSLSIKWLTLLHVVRLPVELMLLALYYHKAVPEVKSIPI